MRITALAPLPVSLAIFLLLQTATTPLTNCFAQGSLAPPGPPAPTMKSLAQIEPRTPVDATHTPPAGFGQFAIQQPGSYYLTTNIYGISGKYGIEIMTNHVAIDLNGFGLFGGGVGSAGIVVDAGANNCTIRNGTISGWGDGLDSSAPNTVVEHVKVFGCTGFAVFNFPPAVPSVIRDCLCESNGTGSTYAGITSAGGVVSDCIVMNNNVGEGINVTGSTTISGCRISANAGYGISLLGPDCQLLGNTCISNQSVNILIGSSNNRIEANHVVTASGIVGIEVSGGNYSNNVIVRNSVSGNGSGNFSNPGNNDFGPIGSAATATSPWANISH